MKVTIMRGLPGVGKTTWARTHRPDALVCSADDYFVDDIGVYRFDASKLEAAHTACVRKFLRHVAASSQPARPVVVDNTNSTAWEISPYVAFACAFEFRVEIVHVRFRSDGDDCNELARRCVHGCSVENIQAMRARWDWSLPSSWPRESVVEVP